MSKRLIACLIAGIGLAALPLAVRADDANNGANNGGANNAGNKGNVAIHTVGGNATKAQQPANAPATQPANAPATQPTGEAAVPATQPAPEAVLDGPTTLDQLIRSGNTQWHVSPANGR